MHDGVTFTGRVTNGVLTGTKQGGTPFSVRKPTTTEVFECSGALALGNDQGGTDTIREVGRDFCAAFHRGVALNTAYWYDPSRVLPHQPEGRLLRLLPHDRDRPPGVRVRLRRRE